MRKTIYIWLVEMHPTEFRNLFGEEMIGIFERSNGQLGFSLMWDAVRSLGRQWLFRTAWWMAAIVVLAAGAELLVAVLSIVWFQFSLRAMVEAGGLPNARLLLLEGAMLIVCVVLTASIVVQLQLTKRQHQLNRRHVR